MDMMKQETQQNSEEQKNNSSDENSPLKTCTECFTIKTPLWRGGPHGPKSLCNACGIKYNKKRREELGLEVVKKKKRSSEVTEILDMLQNMPVGNEAMEQKSQCLMNKLGDEERAAILLMNLSCGSVLA